MKKLSWITGILIGVTVLLAAFGSVCGAVDQMATDEQFYSSMSRAAVIKHLGAENDLQADEKVSEYIGMTDAEQAFAVDRNEQARESVYLYFSLDALLADDFANLQIFHAKTSFPRIHNCRALLRGIVCVFNQQDTRCPAL